MIDLQNMNSKNQHSIIVLPALFTAVVRRNGRQYIIQLSDETLNRLKSIFAQNYFPFVESLDLRDFDTVEKFCQLFDLDELAPSLTLDSEVVRISNYE